MGGEYHCAIPAPPGIREKCNIVRKGKDEERKTSQDYYYSDYYDKDGKKRNLLDLKWLLSKSCVGASVTNETPKFGFIKGIDYLN